MRNTIMSLLLVAMAFGANAAEDKTYFDHSITRISPKSNSYLEVQFTPPFADTQGCLFSGLNIGVIHVPTSGFNYNTIELSFKDYIAALAVDSNNPPVQLGTMLVFEGCTGNGLGDAADRPIIKSVRVRPAQ